MGLVDSHCHLDDKKFNSDRGQVINNLNDNGVDFVISCADSLSSSRKTIELADQYDDVFATIGIHPHNAGEYNKIAESELISMLKNKKVVAVGEIGLDYHYDFSPHDIQMDCMLGQIEIAKKYNKSVIFHIREAYGDFMPLVRSCSLPKKSVLHCFSSSKEIAGECLDNNIMISFTGVITFKNANKIREVVKYTPLDMMMIETDSPYMAPEPYRGKRNEPKYVIEVAKTIAQVKDISIEEVIKITKLNAIDFFGIKL